MQVYDVLIIGGGPSGLAALYSLLSKGMNACLFERGNSYMDRLNNKTPYNISNGLGGAGLLSDGKFSFSPAASYLWGNIKPDFARPAYEKVCEIVNRAGVIFPELMDEWFEIPPEFSGVKEYRTVYASGNKQIRIVDYLSSICTNVNINTEICSIKKKNNIYILKDLTGKKYYGNRVVLASGKYGSYLLIDSDIECGYSFKIELGIRLECDSSVFLPNKESFIDYKLIRHIDSSTQIRTFCYCKNGEVVKSFSNGYYSFNGVKAYSSGMSNIGILLRSENPDSIYASEMINVIGNPEHSVKPFLSCINDFILIGEESDRIIKPFICSLIDLKDVSKLASARIYYPEIEYIGSYPSYEADTLRIPNESIWVIGDVSGKYRGLTAALLSGAYVAEEIIQEGK